MKTRTQSIVYWEFAGYNDYGEETFNYPTELLVRIERRRRRTRDRFGNLTTTNYTINVGQAVVVGSLVWLGTIATLPDPETNLLQITKQLDIPSLKARETDKWVEVLRYNNKPIILYETSYGQDGVTHGGRLSYVTHS